jgi:tetratricopeptide (TPR) repeat protein
MNKLEKALADYVSEPRNPSFNFTLGTCYEELRQYAAAISFYIRTAEYGNENTTILSYESFLRIAICFEIQGNRRQPMKGALLRAITIYPTRPEAYFLLTRMYEQNKEWHEAYAWSVAGENILKDKTIHLPLITDVQYPGRYGFIYERAVVTWWTGLYYESLRLFKLLEKEYKMLPIHEASVKSNIINVTTVLKGKGKYVEQTKK